MMLKLTAIWRILWENHFLLISGRGGFIGVSPKNLDQLQLMKDLTDKLKKIQEEGKNK